MVLMSKTLHINFYVLLLIIEPQIRIYHKHLTMHVYLGDAAVVRVWQTYSTPGMKSVYTFENLNIAISIECNLSECIHMHNIIH